MSIYKYGDDEKRLSLSPNARRRLQLSPIDQRQQHEIDIANDRGDKYVRDVERNDLVNQYEYDHEYSNGHKKDALTPIVQRKIRSGINKDQLGHEMYAGYLVASVALNLTAGIALSAASHITNANYHSRLENDGSNRAVDDLRKSVNKSHENVGHDIAMKFGSDEEKDLLEKVNNDRRAEREAIKNGEIYVPKTDERERARASQVIAKYGGDISTNNGLSRAISNVRGAADRLDAENKIERHKQNVINSNIDKTLADRASDFSKLSAAMQGSLLESKRELASDPKIRLQLQKSFTDLSPSAQAVLIKAGRTMGEADGLQKMLTDPNRRSNNAPISSKSLSPGEAKELFKKIDGATRDVAKLRVDSEKIGESIKRRESERRSLETHAQRLEKDGKILLDSSKTEINKGKAAAKAVLVNSLTKSESKTNNKIDKIKEKANKTEEKSQKLNIRAEKAAIYAAKCLADGKSVSARTLNRVAKLENKANKLHEKSIKKAEKVDTETKKLKKVQEKLDKAKNIDVRKKFASAQSKKSMEQQNKGTQKIMRSISVIDRELSKKVHKGNAIHDEIFGTMRKASYMAQKYELALSVSKFALKGLTMPGRLMVKSGKRAIKFLNDNGKETRLGKKLKSLMDNKFMKGVGKGTKFIGKAGEKLLHAPSTILNAPMKLKNLPKDLVKKGVDKTVRFTRKQVGKVVGKATKAAKKAAKKGAKSVGKKMGKLLKKSKFGRKLIEIGMKTAAKLKNALAVVDKLLTQVKAKIAALIAEILPEILMAIGAVIGFIGYFIGIAIFDVVIIIVLLVVIGAILSVVAAVKMWVESLFVKNQINVDAEPGIIPLYAVNYRNMELDILDLFGREATPCDCDSSQWYTHKCGTGKGTITPSTNPIFGSIYNNYGHLVEEIGSDAIMKDTTTEGLSATNKSALAAYKDALSRYDNFSKKPTNVTIKGASAEDYFIARVDYYDNVTLEYYKSEDLQRDANGKFITDRDGQYVLLRGAVPSEYEISNAKDVLALVDTIYTKKNKGEIDQEEGGYGSHAMQMPEVETYLGVGLYETVIDDNGEMKIHIGSGNSLFWKSHKFIYNSGNSSKDIWFHETLSEPMAGHYSLSSKNGKCDNYEILKYTYTVTVLVPKDPKPDPTPTPDVDSGTKPIKPVKPIEPTIKLSLDSETNDSEAEVEYEEVEMTMTGYIEVCRGHIDLDVDIVVSLLENDDLFEDAMSIKGQEKDKKAKNFLGIYSWGGGKYWSMKGLGNVKIYAYHPDEDWAKDGGNRELAKTKAANKALYGVDPNIKMPKEQMSHYAGYIRKYLYPGESGYFHGLIKNTAAYQSFKMLKKTPDEYFAYGTMFKGTKYYVADFVSGEQKLIPVFRENSKGQILPDLEYINIKLSGGYPVLDEGELITKPGGEIVDMAGEIEQLDENFYRIDGVVSLSAIEATLGVDFSSEYDNFTNLSELIFGQFTAPPADGETPELTIDRLQIKVEEIVEQEVVSALVEILPET